KSYVSRCEMGLVAYRVRIAAKHTSRLQGLNLRIPVEHDLILLQIRSGLVLRWIGLRECRHRPEFAKGVAEFCAHAVDHFFKTDDLQFLRTEVVDHRQQQFHTVVVRWKSFFFKEVPERRHIFSVYAKN